MFSLLRRYRENLNAFRFSIFILTFEGQKFSLGVVLLIFLNYRQRFQGIFDTIINLTPNKFYVKLIIYVC